MNKDEALRLALEALKNNRRTHHYCEDTWYSCPKHEDGCANDSEGDECNCGADEANAEIEQAITAIKAALEAKDEQCRHRIADARNPVVKDGYLCVDCGALFSAADHAMPKQEAKDEPVAWATREDFYRELEHAMNHMRQQMKIKSVTMRCTDYDLALPIIDIFDGRILVGQVTTPPQRKPLDEEELEKLWDEATDHMEHFCSQYWDFARAIEAAHGIKGEV